MRILLLALALVAAAASASGSESLTGGVYSVTVERGDTLRRLGSRFGVDARTIANDNGLSLDQPLLIGTVLTIDNRHIVPPVKPGIALVVNVPQRMLFVTSGPAVSAYPVAVGLRTWQTPLGEFAIASKERNPTWDVPESIRAEARRVGRSLPLKVPPGPNNPLGAYWLGLTHGSVGIHGTNAPSSIYQVTTHGCVRLHPDDIAALFERIEVGAAGVFVYEPVLLAAAGDDLYVEAHGDVYGRGPRDTLEFVQALARERGLFDRVDWSVAAHVLLQRDGVARVVTRR